MIKVRVRIQTISHSIEKETSLWTRIYDELKIPQDCTIDGSYRKCRWQVLSMPFDSITPYASLGETSRDCVDGTKLSTCCICITSHYGFAARLPRIAKSVSCCTRYKTCGSCMRTRRCRCISISYPSSRSSKTRLSFCGSYSIQV